jgi:ribosomal protein S18 acetylase RimI-like enzyme
VAARVVRPAGPDDAADLVRVHLRCWREAYGHLLSEEFLAAREAETDRRAQRWREAIAAGSRPWVALADGEVVGLALALEPDQHPDREPDQHPDQEPDPVRPRRLELAMLYLLASHHGSGLGQQLLDAATGTGPCSLWVAEDNPRARAFYARNGFHPDGARRTEPAFEDIVVVRLVRP